MRPRLIPICMIGLFCLGTMTTINCTTQPTIDTITVLYLNSTDADIQVDLLVSNDPNITQDELLGDGSLFRDTVDAGDSLQFDLSCADAPALIIDQATMLPAGPAVGSTILYQDLDYACGQTVGFEFAASANDTQLDVYLISP
jgi:hypothetical protein